MTARIPLADGDFAMAEYHGPFGEPPHSWVIDRGMESVYVPPGESAMGALRRVYPQATEVPLDLHTPRGGRLV